MKTTTFIEASAEITQVTSLKKGNVYKRLEESDYAESQIVYGVVIDVLYNGEDAAIQTIEFKPGYYSLETKLKTFSGGKEIKVFPATQVELNKYLEDAVASCEREVVSKTEELNKAKGKLDQVREVVSGDLVKNLTTPEYSDPTERLEGEK